jgi:4-alpha-glucanotransferase
VSRGDLRELAALHGLQTAYRDARGRRRVARAAELVAVLGALGVDAGTPAGAARALAARRRDLAGRLVEPVLVAWDGRLRAATAPAGARLALTLEDGADAPVAERDGVLRERAPLPPGYHRLDVRLDRRRASALVISAPRRAWHPPRRATRVAVFAPVHGLRSERSDRWGVGDLDDLDDLARWAGEAGAQLVGTLPLLATFLDEPFEPSPYAPASRLAWNELFLPRGDAHGPGYPPPSGDLVDYRDAVARKRPALAEYVVDAWRTPEVRAGVEALTRDRPHLAEYARFRARGDDDAERVHLVAQWFAHLRLRSIAEAGPRRDVRLYFDLPLGVHAESFDVRTSGDLFCRGASVGAPPDPLAEAGQDWGFPPVHPDVQRETGYAYLRASLRHSMEHAAALRVDHVMGVHRLFFVPREIGATGGVYVRYPAAEIYAVISLESHRNRCQVIGENLGTVPRAITTEMGRHGLAGMHVAQFAIDPGARPPALAPPRGTLASLNTHDLPTWAGWWHGDDIDDRAALGWTAPADAASEHAGRARARAALAEAYGGSDADPAPAMRGVLGRLAAGGADIVVVALEDLWGERRPQNVPGTTTERPNWRGRLRYRVEELPARDEVARTLRAIPAPREDEEP